MKSKSIQAKKIQKVRRMTLFTTTYASIYSVEIYNSLNLELQLKDTKSAIRNKLIDLLTDFLLTELKSFKFVRTLVLEFKN